MAYSDNFPATRPVFMADFANGGKIDPRITFSRPDSPINSSNAPASAVHYWSNEKHESSQNLVLQSQNFDTTWATYHLATSGALTGSQSAPDGTSTGWLVTAGAQSSGSPFLRQSLSGIKASTQYTVSAYVKAGTASHGFISLRGDSGHVAWAEIDFSSPLSPTTGGQYFSGISATSTAVGSGGWYRLTLTSTTSTAGSPSAYVGPSDGTNPNNNGYPVWNCNGETINVWGYQVEERGSATVYNATTTQIHREYAPTLKSVSTAGQPRFEYSPTDSASAALGESLGLLVESSVANVIPYSKNGYNASNAFQFTTTYGITTTENAAISPSGNLDATLITEDTSTGSHQWQISPNVVAGKNTISVYVKPVGGADYFGIRVTDTNTYGAVFTFSTQAVTNYGVTPEASKIEALSNGWYRVSITQTLSAGARLTRFNIMDPSGSYTGNGYRGCLTYGYQCEANAFPSSWIDTGTGGSGSTRASDSASAVLSDIGYTGGPLTLVADSTTETDTLNPVTFHVYKNGDHQISLNAKSDNNRAAYIEADNSYSILTSPAAGNGVRALRVDTNDIATALNGTIDGTDTSQTLPDLTGGTVYFGDDSNGGNSIDGHIKRLAIYNEALSDTNLQAITS